MDGEMEGEGEPLGPPFREARAEREGLGLFPWGGRGGRKKSVEEGEGRTISSTSSRKLTDFDRP